jgi:hypothetical protein
MTLNLPRKRLLLVGALLLFLLGITTTPISNSQPIIAATTSTSSASNTQTLLGPVVLTPGTSIYKQLSTVCYALVVNMTVLNNSTTVQSIQFQSFFITIILPNQPVGNTTNTSFFSPNNLLTSILLFPPSPSPIPIIMQISYNNVCLPPGTSPANDIKLVYYDGSVYRAWSPTFPGNNRITWT